MFFDNTPIKKEAKQKIIQIDADPINSDWIKPDHNIPDGKCLIMPLGKFGDHDLGYSGCAWCDQSKTCIEKNPNIGKSLIAVKPKSQRFRRR